VKWVQAGDVVQNNVVRFIWTLLVNCV
jgi:hypothetical protein